MDMARNDQDHEQSMDDILASIRKIIAEDSAVNKPAERAPPKVPVTASSLDDVLGLADDPPAERSAVPPPPAPKPAPHVSESGVPSWSFPKAPAGPAAGGTPRSYPGVTARSPGVASPPPATPPPVPAATEAAPKPPTSASTPRTGLGAFVPGRPEANMRPAAAETGAIPASRFDPAPHRPAESRPPEEKSASLFSSPADKVSTPSPVSELAGQETLRAPTRPTEPLGEKLPSLADRINGSQPPASAPGPRAIGAGEEAVKSSPSVAAGVPAASATAAAPPVASSPRPAEPLVSPEKSALDALLKEAAGALPPMPGSAAQPAAGSAGVPATDMKPATAAAAGMGPLTSSPATVAPPSPAPVAQAVAAETAGAPRTLEDTVSELLRPMLRQWLDQNMPRVLEKALRSELAAGMTNKTDERKS